MADKFLIAPFKTGLEKDLKPWLIPEDAFSQLNNAYVFRGRIRKRFGSVNFGSVFDFEPKSSRLRIKVGTTHAGTGNLSGTVPGGADNIGAIGQQFSIGDESFTVTLTNGTMLKTGGTASTYTYNTATGAYVFVAAALNTDVYFYPAKPVMGFANYESTNINQEPTYAYDTFFAYAIVNNGWERLDGETVAGDSQWSGSDSDFFWSTTYRGLTADLRILFVTNYVRADQMRYFNGTDWTSWNPDTALGGNDTIESCRVMIPFKDRLVLLNTLEQVGSSNTKVFVNRCRYSHKGSPLAAKAYVEGDDGTGGGYIDCTTKEAIISAYEFKDRLIVFFERSTWELVYTSNELTPFVWREVNIERGAESTFSIVPFDTAILGIGQEGINACNGYNVERIDARIPDEVFKFHNDDDGPTRVHGIRDYRAEMVYWAVPAKTGSSKYPSKILAFNYITNSWAFFDDSITAFGYYYYIQDQTWQELNMTWEQADFSWNSFAIEEGFRTPIAGNQEGFTFVILPDITFNAWSLQITDITVAAGVVTIKSMNHNLESGDWIAIEFAQGITSLNNQNFSVKKITDDTFTIDEPPTTTGTYTGGGVIRLVSKIDIKTKRFNFYTRDGKGTSIQKADFFIDRIDNSEITIDYIPSASGVSLREHGIATGAILGDSILDLSAYDLKPLEANQKRFWHAVYTQAQGENVQLQIYWNDEQMKDQAITEDGFTLHAILFHASPIEEY